MPEQAAEHSESDKTIALKVRPESIPVTPTQVPTHSICTPSFVVLSYSLSVCGVARQSGL